jgi:hypothetical protein
MKPLLFFVSTFSFSTTALAEKYSKINFKKVRHNVKTILIIFKIRTREHQSRETSTNQNFFNG